jgi:hypothetical protein
LTGEFLTVARSLAGEIGDALQLATVDRVARAEDLTGLAPEEQRLVFDQIKEQRTGTTMAAGEISPVLYDPTDQKVAIIVQLVSRAAPRIEDIRWFEVEDKAQQATVERFLKKVHGEWFRPEWHAAAGYRAVQVLRDPEYDRRARAEGLDQLPPSGQ